MSVTSFPSLGKTYGIIYGVTESTFHHVKWLMNQIAQSDTALHPLLLPMVFAELERRRLLDDFDGQKGMVYDRINYLKHKFRSDEKPRERSEQETPNGPFEEYLEPKEESDSELTDSAATDIWMTACLLKTGLAGMKAQLVRMIEHSEWLSKAYYSIAQGDRGDTYVNEREVGERIEARLREMIDELDSKISHFETLLGGMSLATQMVQFPNAKLCPTHLHGLASTTGMEPLFAQGCKGEYDYRRTHVKGQRTDEDHCFPRHDIPPGNVSCGEFPAAILLRWSKTNSLC